ncbi:MAG: LacI family DNA-binding transcriptional regulator [Fibrella sp.]|nr:LacI family DNA-binding transcriptional regulator [Armatimonadota bacterium]
MTETGFKVETQSPVAIRDVAARAGVSRATASKALNPAAMSVIAPATRERVQRVARELGYYPSAIARGLSRKRMDTLGIVLTPGTISPNESPFFGILFTGILQAAAAHGQNVTLFVGETWCGAVESLPRFRDGRCDGFLIFYQTSESDIIDALVNAGVPTVLVDDRRDNPNLSWVDVDNRGSARTMTEYLIGLGHRRIAFITDNDPESSYIENRLVGYRETMDDKELARQEVRLTYADATNGGVYIAAERLARLPVTQRPTALFCTSDSAAGSAIEALKDCGLRVPEDISVSGFNDDNGAKDLRPALTTMRQPYASIGEQAISLLVEQVSDISRRGRQVMLPTELVVRNSTGPAPTGG